MDRRTFLAAAPIAACVPAAASAGPDIRALVEDVMQAAVPASGGMGDKYQTVRVPALKALCEGVGLEWTSHWSDRS